MMRAILIVLFAGCVTHDSGCGSGINSETAEKQVSKAYGKSVVCIKDDEHTFSCASESEQRMYRCAESSSAKGNIKCIPWFPLE